MGHGVPDPRAGGLADRWAAFLPSRPPQGLHRDSGAGQRHPDQHSPDEQQRRRLGRQGSEGLPRAQTAPAGVRGAQWVAEPLPLTPVLGPLLPWCGGGSEGGPGDQEGG